VGNLAGGAGGGAAAASYAATGKMTKADSGKKVWKIQDDESDAALELVDGEYELKFIVTQKAISGLKDTMKTQVLIGFSLENGVVKPKQYTGHVTLMK
jgi:thiamine monophosphate kinase